MPRSLRVGSDGVKIHSMADPAAEARAADALVRIMPKAGCRGQARLEGQRNSVAPGVAATQKDAPFVVDLHDRSAAAVVAEGVGRADRVAQRFEALDGLLGDALLED